MYDYNDRLTFSNRKRPTWRRRIFSISMVLVLAASATFGYLRWANVTPTSESASTSTLALELPGRKTSPSAQSASTSTTRIPFEPRTLKKADTGGPTDPINTTAQTNETTSKIDTPDWIKVSVAAGDNLSLIFGRHGFSKKNLHEILAIDTAGKNLRRIKPGQVIKVKAEEDGRVLGVMQELDYRRSLHVNWENNEYVASIVEVEPEIRVGKVIAEIEQSLFLDGIASGLADKTIMELTDIFGWDIDFVLDVRAGDEFSVVFEEIFKDGEKVKNGKILAAEFINRGEKLRAIYYANEDGHSGYYSDTGQAMQKAFLRTPVNFTRISSRFNLKRRHPVLNKIRAHKGVDYAAPHGTPIRATASGKVMHAGNKGGYGRTVIVRHGDSYSTLFAHMSRYARGIKKGAKVKQGQTIGYVGKTGLATGPHLHYEFRINGVHRNPLKVDLPKALPIDKKYIDDFRSKAAPLIAELDELRNNASTEELVAGLSHTIRSASSPYPRSATQ